MKRVVQFVAVLLLAVVATSFAMADDTNALKAQLETRYAAMKTAMASHNTIAIQALLAPGFVSIDTSGQEEDAQQMIAEVEALPADPNKKSATTLLSVEQVGKIATVKQQYQMTTVKEAADGSTENVHLVTLSTDMWVDPKGSWLLQKTVTNRLDYYINGKLAVHKPS